MSTFDDTHMTRRDFLATSATVAAGAAMVAATPSLLLAKDQPTTGAAKDKAQDTSILAPRKMGRVGFVVPAAGYGAMLTTQPQLAAAVFDQGFYFVHSSPGYTGRKSYESLKTLLADKDRRKKVVLALKIDPGRVDEDLKYFGLDHIDMIVPPKDRPEHLNDERFIAAAEKVRKAGKVRGIGWACHSDTVGTLTTAAELGVFDVALIGYKNTSPEFLAALKAAKDKGLGVFAMKFGARPDKPDRLATRMKWLTTTGLADSVLLSFEKAEQIQPALEIKLGALSAAEAAALRFERVQELASECSWCNRCVDPAGQCPNGVAIPQIMRYNYYLTERGWTERATGKYAALAAACSAAACVSCGACEKACPQHLPVRELLAQAHQRLA